MVVCGSSVNGLRQQEIGALIKVHMGCFGNEKKKEKIQAGERLPWFAELIAEACRGLEIDKHLHVVTMPFASLIHQKFLKSKSS